MMTQQASFANLLIFNTHRYLNVQHPFSCKTQSHLSQNRPRCSTFSKPPYYGVIYIYNRPIQKRRPTDNRLRPCPLKGVGGSAREPLRLSRADGATPFHVAEERFSDVGETSLGEIRRPPATSLLRHGRTVNKVVSAKRSRRVKNFLYGENMLAFGNSFTA